MTGKFTIILLALLAPLFLAGCAVDIAGAKPGQAISIVQVQTYMDNEATSLCQPSFRLVEKDQILPFDYIMGKGYYVFQTPPGTIQLVSLYCAQYRVLFTKQRTHTFADGPSFQAQAGRINYAGKIKVNYWMPDVNAADLFNAGSAESDDDRVQMKLLDDYKNAQGIFLDKYKKLPPGFTFQKSPFGKNELFD